jgi:hypothetical protein
MGLKEALEELIDDYEEDLPFLSPGQQQVLATYHRLLAEENKKLVEQTKPKVGIPSSSPKRPS